jgi:hypothetical protein
MARESPGSDPVGRCRSAAPPYVLVANNLTAIRGDDGSVTVHFGGCGTGRPNCLPVMDGWNYVIRLYRPRAKSLDGALTFPAPTASALGERASRGWPQLRESVTVSDLP